MSKIKGIVKRSILGIGGQLHRNNKSKLLYYHDVYKDECYTDMGTSWQLFAQHLDAISCAGYEIVPSIEKPVGQVSLLFDDGFRGIYDCRDLLYERNIRPTIFLAVSLIGEPDYLTKEEILELQGLGFIFESHGWSHSDMTQYDDEELNRELIESRQYLSELLEKDISEICLPIGYYSNHLIEKAFAAGYRTIYCSVPGNYDDMVEGMRPRNLVQNASPKEIKLILRGGNSLLRKHYINLHRRG